MASWQAPFFRRKVSDNKKVDPLSLGVGYRSLFEAGRCKDSSVIRAQGFNAGCENINAIPAYRILPAFALDQGCEPMEARSSGDLHIRLSLGTVTVDFH